MSDDDECLPFHIKNTLSMETLHSLPLNLKNHRLQQELQLLIRRFPAQKTRRYVSSLLLVNVHSYMRRKGSVSI